MTYVLRYIQEISFKEIKYGIFFGAVLLAVLLFLHVKKNYPIRCMFAAMLLYAILFVIFASTVLTRPDYGYYNYKMELFWSWRNVIEKQNRAMLLQIFTNMLILIPAGFLFPIAAPGARFKHTFFFGLWCTGTIEVLQLVLQRGLFEWDDIIHNMVGVCVGYGVYWILTKIIFKSILQLKNRNTNGEKTNETYFIQDKKICHDSHGDVLCAGRIAPGGGAGLRLHERRN